MPSTPIFSFVIPVYNKPPEVFRKCLKSLYDQSLKDNEIICVFDGENEELAKVLIDFKKVKSFIIEHGGACKARNYGLSVASGEYVVFWDADCYIKPDTAKRWLEEFTDKPEVDFVYSGFEYGDEKGGLKSEPFDPYSLTCGNYISSMSPIKRSKAIKWDEGLVAAQDWDYWLRVVQSGSKGSYIEGAGFVTDTIRTGISSDHWSENKREETIERIRVKHGFQNRDIGVYAVNFYSKAVKIAKVLDGDVLKPTGHAATRYKTIFNLDYNELSRFEGISPETVKIQYWLPGYIAGLEQAKYLSVMETIRIAKGVINLCGSSYEKNHLGEMGIEAEVLPLPVLTEDFAKVQTELPKDFSVLVLTDEAYGELFKDLQSDLPHIKFGFKGGLAKDYSCVLSFHNFATVDEAILMSHINGRHVISNVQAPFCGFIDPEQSGEKFKSDLFERLRIVRGLPYNKEASDYYKQIADPNKFKEKIASYRKVNLEVVA